MIFFGATRRRSTPQVKSPGVVFIRAPSKPACVLVCPMPQKTQRAFSPLRPSGFNLIARPPSRISGRVSDMFPHWGSYVGWGVYHICIPTERPPQPRSPIGLNMLPDCVPILRNLKRKCIIFLCTSAQSPNLLGRDSLKQTHACAHTSMHGCMHAFMHACMHTCMHAHMRRHVRHCTCTRMCARRSGAVAVHHACHVE